MSNNINTVIGQQLKKARVVNGWSLDTSSKNTGVSKAMLGQIERAESSPTIAKLWAIASGFNLPLSYFLVAIADGNNAKIVLKTEQGISATTLFAFDSVTGMEVLSLTLMPLHQQMSLPHNDGVIEHIVVVEGEMEYFLKGQWHHLQRGETVKFKADKKHGYRNLNEQQAIFHNIISYPSKNSNR
ncbi:helix-turn-helix domain-containing protein [Psychromonas sp. Urea-02u-13]|uniref:helix-turn-helix domain-containing protein n=1 Tax=Psychromonas sp. Urea-02u-13 TaxID=2058326 RepID=UPI000C337AF3|nr:XRE family transcriptional regulator [Psychromonas sp. Urea-02u-13]PKG37636.1 hypothetical protein CXF74_17835 [Psychromonas sp. Urea-02u-13]